MYDNIQKIRFVSQKLLCWGFITNFEDPQFSKLVNSGNSGDRMEKILNKIVELENITANYYQLDKTFFTSASLYLRHILKYVLLLSNETYIGYYSIKFKNKFLNLQTLCLLNLSAEELFPEGFDNKLMDYEENRIVRKIFEDELDILMSTFNFFYYKTSNEQLDENIFNY